MKRQEIIEATLAGNRRTQALIKTGTVVVHHFRAEGVSHLVCIGKGNKGIKR
jgi:hypothetical protein